MTPGVFAAGAYREKSLVGVTGKGFAGDFGSDFDLFFFFKFGEVEEPEFEVPDGGLVEVEVLDDGWEEEFVGGFKN